MEIDLNTEMATLVAAVIAALASFGTIVLTGRGKQQEELRAATRQAIAENLNEIGRLIYEVVALSNIQTKATSDQSHKVKYANARAAAAKLKNKRLEVRYSLWGVDKGLRELSRLPDWVGHAKAIPAARLEILNAGTKLADELDAAIRHAYLSGALPNAMTRWRVARSAKKFRKAYEGFQRLPRAS